MDAGPSPSTSSEGAATAPLVSVVVAFYNVEECVDFCVRSLLAQTFDDYELVLVDDGSTDSTGVILDGYAFDPQQDADMQREDDQPRETDLLREADLPRKADPQQDASPQHDTDRQHPDTPHQTANPSFAPLAHHAENPLVRVLHKENGGLSDARNYGVTHSRGAYVTFVDGDDLVSPYYLQALVSGLECGAEQARALKSEHSLDQALPASRMVIGALKYVRHDDAMQGNVTWCDPSTGVPADAMPASAPAHAKPAPAPAPDGTASPSTPSPATSASAARETDLRTLVHEILYEEMSGSACSKLAPREVYLAHPFPKGALYEDLAIIADHLLAVESFAVIREPIYCYALRQGSIVSRASAPAKHAHDYGRALARAERRFSEMPFDLQKSLTYQKCLRYARIYSLTRIATPRDEEVMSLEREALRYIRANLGRELSDGRAPLGSKIRFALLSVSPGLYNVALRAFKRVFRGV